MKYYTQIDNPLCQTTDTLVYKLSLAVVTKMALAFTNFSITQDAAPNSIEKMGIF